MILVQLIEGYYCEIISLGSNPNDYIIGDNQKIIIEHNWVFKTNGEAYNKDALVWDDKDKQVILYPEPLKISIYRKQKLKEFVDRLDRVDYVIGEQILANIVTAIKSANTIPEIDIAAKMLDDNKASFLKRIGL